MRPYLLSLVAREQTLTSLPPPFRPFSPPFRSGFESIRILTKNTKKTHGKKALCRKRKSSHVRGCVLPRFHFGQSCIGLCSNMSILAARNALLEGSHRSFVNLPLLLHSAHTTALHSNLIAFLQLRCSANLAFRSEASVLQTKSIAT